MSPLEDSHIPFTGGYDRDFMVENPNFCKLVKSLFGNHLAHDALPKRMEIELNNKLNNLEKERINCYKHEVTLNQIQQLIQDFDSQSSVMNSLTSEIGYEEKLGEIKQIILKIQTRRYIKDQLNRNKNYLEDNNNNNRFFIGKEDENNSSNDINFMGLSSDEDFRIDKTCDCSIILDQLVSQLEKKYLKIEEYCQFWDGDDLHASKSPIERFDELIIEVNKMKTELEAEKSSLKNLTIETDNLYYNYYNLLFQILNLYMKLFQEKLKNQNFTEIYVRWLQNRSKTMILKLNLLQYQILSETYTQERVVALKEIRNQIQLRIQGLQMELEKAGYELEHYESVGSSFMDLVKEYVSVLEKINNKNWALDQLKKH